MTTKLETIKEYEARTGKVGGITTAASNIKRELADRFHGVKFSVTTKHGTQVLIKWFDGPTEKEVEGVVSKYSGSHFDAMQDLNIYDHTNFNQTYGSATYLRTSRSHSEKFLKRIAEITKDEFGWDVPGIEVLESGSAVFKDTDVFVGNSHNDWYWNMKYVAERKARETSEMDYGLQ